MFSNYDFNNNHYIFKYYDSIYINYDMILNKLFLYSCMLFNVLRIWNTWIHGNWFCQISDYIHYDITLYCNFVICIIYLMYHISIYSMHILFYSDIKVMFYLYLLTYAGANSLKAIMIKLN